MAGKGTVLAAALALSACASLETTPPVSGAAAVDAARLDQQRAAIDERLALTRRVHDLAWPLFSANADLCGEKAGPTLGLVLADARGLSNAISGLRRRDAEFAGYDDKPRVIAAPAGSPAAKAGLTPGDVVVSVGEDADPDEASLKEVGRGLDDAMKRHKDGQAETIAIAVERDGVRREFRIAPEKTCRYPIRLGSTPVINASTNGSSITIHAGIARALSDKELQFVIAHELGHSIMRHPGKATRASVFSGRLFVGIGAGLVGTVGDIGLSLIGRAPEVPLATRGAALAVSPFGTDFEREADYWGVYLVARAGGDVEGLESAFDVLATLRPTSTWAQVVHPPTPDRRVAVRLAAEEVREKRARGAELLPEGYEPPEADAR
ncbi:MAG: M48 family metalloprotease [Pseudomonadota bacterium]